MTVGSNALRVSTTVNGTSLQKLGTFANILKETTNDQLREPLATIPASNIVQRLILELDARVEIPRMECTGLRKKVRRRSMLRPLLIQFRIGTFCKCHDSH